MQLRLSNKFSFSENVYFFILVLCTGMSCKYTQALMYPTNYVCTLLMLFFSLHIFIKHKLQLDKKAKIAISIICSWVLIQYIETGEFYLMTFFLLFEIFIAYVIVNVYGTNLFILYEKNVSVLALLNLYVWFTYLIVPHVVEALLSPLNMIEPNNVMKISLGIITISNSSSYLGMRNSGFAQEPGFYSCLIGIAMYFNLIINKFRIKRNWNFYILLLSIITSQSTTGYIILLLLISFYIQNQNFKTKFFLIPFFVVCLPTIIALPFMKEKIIEYWFSADSFFTLKMAALNEDSTYVPQRIEGIVFEAMNFLHAPIIGYGIETDNSYISKMIASNIYLSNGLVKIFSMYGILGGILFWIGLIKSVNEINKLYNISGCLFFILLYVLIGISYDFNFIPLILSIWFFSFFSSDFKKQYFTKSLSLEKRLTQNHYNI